MKAYLTKKVVGMLALTLALGFAAQPATARTRHHHPSASRSHPVRLAFGQPTQIPILDDNLHLSDIGSQFAMTQVKAQAAQAYTTGSGVKVAVLDGGFDLEHEALQGHLDPADWDALDGDYDAQDKGNDVDDDHDGQMDWLVGHGTFVSSVILNVAPNATILPIRVLDDEGWGTEDSVAQGVYYAIAQGCKVINMSLVVPDASGVLRAALRSAADQGIVVVGSAGNQSGVWYDDPSLADRVLAVGAVTPVDVLCPWSVTGSNVDCYAPGSMVVGALGGDVANSYARWSGTSFAAPFVAGGAALLKSMHPLWTADHVCSRILNNVDLALGVWPLNRGRVNLLHAVDH